MENLSYFYGNQHHHNMKRKGLRGVYAGNDPWSLVIITTTFILFFIALFVNELTHDLLLEAGVFLVSVRLIMMNSKITVTECQIMERPCKIRQLIHETSNHSSRP